MISGLSGGGYLIGMTDEPTVSSGPLPDRGGVDTVGYSGGLERLERNSGGVDLFPPGGVKQGDWHGGACGVRRRKRNAPATLV